MCRLCVQGHLMRLLPIWLGMQRSQTLSQISNVSASSGQTHSTTPAPVFLIIRLLFFGAEPPFFFCVGSVHLRCLASLCGYGMRVCLGLRARVYGPGFTPQVLSQHKPCSLKAIRAATRAMLQCQYAN